MPNCFQLFPKGSSTAATLVSVDEAMCAHFNQPVDPDKYLGGWYDCIGFRLAMGKTFEQVIEQFRGYIAEQKDDSSYYETQILIAEWLMENYTTDSWTEIGRR